MKFTLPTTQLANFDPAAFADELVAAYNAKCLAVKEANP